MNPTITPTKHYSGEIKRDYLAFKATDRSPDDKLALMLKHVDYLPSEVERICARNVIRRLDSKYVQPFDIAEALQSVPVLQDFAYAIYKGFCWKTKETVRWQTVYALMAKIGPDSETISSEFGSTEKSIEDVVIKLQDPRTSQHITKRGRFLHDVDEQGTACYLWPLQSHAGDLDATGRIKDEWKLVGLANGVRFPYRHYTLRGSWENPKGTILREWPPFDLVARLGIKVRPQ